MEWIKVNQASPRDDSFLIAFGKRTYEIELDGTDEEEPNSVWNAYYSTGCFYCFCARGWEGNMDQMVASHWMPLPAPPKE